jgi:hypothetical protein
MESVKMAISVNKDDLAKHENLGKRLSLLSIEVKELPAACLYLPSPGRLKDMIDVLEALCVNYIVDTSSVSKTF